MSDAPNFWFELLDVLFNMIKVEADEVLIPDLASLDPKKTYTEEELTTIVKSLMEKRTNTLSLDKILTAWINITAEYMPRFKA